MIGYELRLGFMAKGITIKQVEKYLFLDPDDKMNNYSSIIEIQAILS